MGREGFSSHVSNRPSVPPSTDTRCVLADSVPAASAFHRRPQCASAAQFPYTSRMGRVWLPCASLSQIQTSTRHDLRNLGSSLRKLLPGSGKLFLAHVRKQRRCLRKQAKTDPIWRRTAGWQAAAQLHHRTVQLTILGFFLSAAAHLRTPVSRRVMLQTEKTRITSPPPMPGCCTRSCTWVCAYRNSKESSNVVILHFISETPMLENPSQRKIHV